MSVTVRDNSKALRLISIACSLGLLASDRYSYGFGGGETISRDFMWQRPVAGLLAGLLVIALVITLRAPSGTPAARPVMLTEAAGFIIYNGVLLGRDGLGRLLWNYEHAPIGFALVTVGVAARYVAIRSGRPLKAPA
jgi:hypothetical protein